MINSTTTFHMGSGTAAPVTPASPSFKRPIPPNARIVFRVGAQIPREVAPHRPAPPIPPRRRKSSVVEQPSVAVELPAIDRDLLASSPTASRAGAGPGEIPNSPSAVDTPFAISIAAPVTENADDDPGDGQRGAADDGAGGGGGRASKRSSGDALLTPQLSPRPVSAARAATSPRYAVSSSMPFDGLEVEGHLALPPHLAIHLPEHPAEQEAEPSGPWQVVCNSLLLTAGILLKTVGGVYPARQLGGAVSSALMQMHVAFMPEDDPVAEAVYSVLVMATYAVAIAYICGKFISPTTSAFLTHMQKDGQGKDQVVRRGGCAHNALSVGLAELPFVALLLKATIDGVSTPEGPERYLVVMACLTGAIKTLIYGASRGIFERVGAKLMPTRTIVDAQGVPVSAEDVKLLNPRRAAYQWPVTLAANVFVISSILLLPFEDDPLSETTGATGAYVSVYIGLYEAIVAFADVAATAGSAHQFRRAQNRTREGWSMALNLKKPLQPSPADKAADNAGFHIPPELKQRAAAVVESIEVDQCMSRLKKLFKRPSPDVYAIVTGLRNGINLGLNLSLDSHVVAKLGVDLSIALHALVLSFVELSPIILEGGIGAIATEGKGDREMFDKLHQLFLLQDVIYAQMHGRPHPEAEMPVIRRQLDPAIQGLIAGNTTFDDVRTHLHLLRHSMEPRGAEADPVTDFVLYKPKYPTKAMKQKFGGVISAEPLMDGSRIKSAIDQFVNEVIAEMDAEEEADQAEVAVA